jgi:cobalamin biosynthesis protein CbiG
MRRAIGFGCSSRAKIDDVVALVRSVSDGSVRATLATHERRATFAQVVAARLDLDLVVFPAAALAEVPGTLSTSALAAAHVGTANVAEAAALAALGPAARLVVAKRIGRHCTCAVAEVA